MKAVCTRMIRGNRGDMASRYGILSQLYDINVKDITVFCDNKADIVQLPYLNRQYGYLYNLIPHWSGFKKLLRSDCVIWTAGIDLQDDSSLVKLCHTACAFFLYRLLGKKIFVLMQGAGPISKKTGAFFVQLIIWLTTRVLVRDSSSYNLLCKITRNNTKLICGYDGIFCSSFQNILTVNDLHTHLQTSEHQQLKIGFNIRLWFHFTQSILPYHFHKKTFQTRARVRMDQLIDASVQSIEEFLNHSDIKIILISMYEPGSMAWEDDTPFLQAIKDKFADNNRVEYLEEPLNLQSFCISINKLDLMIGMRLHATLIALRFGIPAINLNYTLKGRDIFNDMGLGKYVIEVDDFINKPHEVCNKANQALSDTHLPDLINSFIAKASARNTSILQSMFTGDQ